MTWPHPALLPFAAAMIVLAVGALVLITRGHPRHPDVSSYDRSVRAREALRRRTTKETR